MTQRRYWQPWEVGQLRLQYPHMLTAVIAVMLERPVESIYAKASTLGLVKTAEFFATPAAARTNGRQGIHTRFKKGQEPPNKGLRRPGWFRGRMRETQFKRGSKPHTWKPIGAERINADGYRDRKVTDTGYPPRDWVGVHRLNWIAAHGPIPPGHIVRFKDGNKLNPELANLELVSLAENMRRNTLHRYPKEIRHAIQLRGALIRQINKRTER